MHQTHKNKRSGLDTWKRKAILMAIPVYPAEITGKELSKETGVNITALIASLSVQIMICEDDGKYSWLDQSYKERTIRSFG